MGFRLRGGSPKNMRQGIYWVQRHLSATRAAERRHAAERRRVDKQNEVARKFNEKWHRISSNVSDYFTRYADLEAKVSESARDKIVDKINVYNRLKDSIQNNIETASMGELSKLATAGRACVLLCAKARGQKAAYDAGSKILTVEGLAYDFA
jgi:hypothetical protein